jgi:hypothetical protein
MDLGHSKSVTPLGSSMESHGPRINKNAFRRFQKFLAGSASRCQCGAEGCIAPAASGFSGLQC